MNLILFEQEDNRIAFYPFTLNKSIVDLRLGIFTLKEKWQNFLCPEMISVFTSPMLQLKYTLEVKKNNTWINAILLPSVRIIEAIQNLKNETALVQKGCLLAYQGEISDFNQLTIALEQGKIEQIELNEGESIQAKWDLFLKNDSEIKKDFQWIQSKRKSKDIPCSVRVFGSEKDVFIEEGAELLDCSLNTQNGPVYIGRNAQIMEGTMIRGPLALGESAILKMGTKIYGATTIGPHCRAGGELNNVIMMAYSNKGHDGFLGNSVIGEWCNLGADTNNSNLKNNYGEVRVWDYKTQNYEASGLQFCGLFMGDYSKSGINTMFNTGTVVGMAANIFGAGFPSKWIPSFSWSEKKYKLDLLYQDINEMMKRRSMILEETEKTILAQLYQDISV